MAATTIVLTCGCGKGYQVFFPKTVLFEAGVIDPISDDITESLEHYQRIDAEEETAGGIGTAEEASKRRNQGFIDSRNMEVFSCSCGKDISLAAILQAFKKKR